MKILLLLLTNLIGGVLFAQNKHMVPEDKWSEDLYISDKFCTGKGLSKGETNGLQRAWNNSDIKAKYSRVVDIRLYFSTAEEASEYLINNTKELSENGDPIEYNKTIPGASNLQVYREGEKTRKLNKALGMEMNMYYFLFTEKNYLAKVFINAASNVGASDVEPFAAEAAKRLGAAIK